MNRDLESSGKFQGEDRRWNKHSIFDGVDRLSGNLHGFGQLGLGKPSVATMGFEVIQQTDAQE